MVTLDEAKSYCRINGERDDAEVVQAIAAAGDHLKSIGVDIDADPLPPAVRMAWLLLCSHFFDNRSATGKDVFPIAFGVDRLITPYRSFGV